MRRKNKKENKIEFNADWKETAKNREKGTWFKAGKTKKGNPKFPTRTDGMDSMYRAPSPDND